jgi:hypothetical protein
MYRTIVPIILVLAAAAGAQAQGAAGSIDPGMSKEQVVERLGAPLVQRSSGSFTYLFYANGCERECGMNDLVILENDAVVDALFRSPVREYTGSSSSPRGVKPEKSSTGGEELTVPSPDQAQARPRRAPAASGTGAAPPPSPQRSGGEVRLDPITPAGSPSEVAPTAATPALSSGQTGIAHGRDAALRTPAGVPAGTTTTPGMAVPAPGAGVQPQQAPPFAGAKPAPEDSARAARDRQRSDTTAKP